MDLEIMRHSAAHVMAAAVCRLYENVKLDIGPATEDGFYYDFDLPKRISPEDFPAIEKEMAKIISERLPFIRSELSRDEARKQLETADQTFKLERLADIPEGETVTFYHNGTFSDLCRGPHLDNTGDIKAFKLLNVASAYFRGDEKNKQLQRIYGTAFASQKELKDWLEMQEEAKKRDHRKLGKELGIFAFDDDVGPGLPLWLPNGAAMIEALEKLAKDTEFAAGYQRVKTPHICKEKMYVTSGHLPYYKDSMFPPMDFDGVKYYLKPMNCPHHHKIFAAQPRSYRDMPLRLAEYGSCYRYEQGGTLFGLMRVRAMNMNDAHIYCRLDQFEEEFLDVCKMYLNYFKIFGIEKYVMRFSTHSKEGLGKKYVDQPELWLKTEQMVRDTLSRGGINFVEVANEAAFYGPKIDVEVFSAIGREFTLATNQVDFAVPARFGLTYKTADNTDETPLCIHRAPLGTHERFIGFLIEHYAGAFPFWLSPEQVRVLPISEGQLQYAGDVVKKLRDLKIRATCDEKNDKIGAKIRRARGEKVPYMLIVGQKEVEAGTVSVRTRTDQDLGALSVDDLLKRFVNENVPGSAV